MYYLILPDKKNLGGIHSGIEGWKVVKNEITDAINKLPDKKYLGLINSGSEGSKDMKNEVMDTVKKRSSIAFNRINCPIQGLIF